MVGKHDWLDFNIGKDATLKARIGWQGLTTSEYLDSGDYILVTGTDFENGQVGWETCHFVDAWRYEQDKNIQLKTNDLLITKDGTIGKIGFVDALDLPATLNSGIFIIRPKNSKLDQRFLYYIFTSKIFEDFLNKLTAGSTINHLYQKDFIHFSFKAPKVEEQQAIAQALSNTDNLITSLGKLITKKEAIKQGTMQQLLTGKKRLAGFSGEWEEKKLGDIVHVIGGGTPSTTISNFWNGSINWFTPTEIGKVKYVFESIRKITEDGLQSSSARLLPVGTILLTSRAGIGDCAILQTPSTTNQGFQSLVPMPNTDSEFVYYLALTLKEKFLQKASGSTFLEISPNNVKDIDILVPLKDEQQAIAKVLSDMDDEIEMLKRKLSKTKAIKEAMMSELLTGKTRLKVTDS
jgi:type I restriction enzyme S subunit